MKTVEQMARECHMSHLVDGGEFDYARGLAKFATLVMEECAAMCDAYASEQWAIYKGRNQAKWLGRGSPHTEGTGDGADFCADAIRAAAKDLK